MKQRIRKILMEAMWWNFDKKIMPVEEANAKYNMNFTELKWEGEGIVTIGNGDTVFILLKHDQPIAWFLFDERKGKSELVEISETGMYVVKGFRNQGIGKHLIQEVVKYFDRKHGRGKYFFDSVVVTRKGKKMAQYRTSLVGNPQDQLVVVDYTAGTY